MRRPPRVALFAPCAPHFVATLRGLGRGFEEAGCEEVHVGWPPLDPRMLRAFVASFRPDLILEINRTADMAFEGPPPCLHVAWIEAARYETQWIGDRLTGGDRLYFMVPPDLLGVEVPDGDWSLLPPGADLDVFHPAPTERRWDLSLCGHLYGPPTPDFLALPVVVRGEAVGTMGDLWRAAERWPLERHTRPYAAVVDNVIDHYRGMGVALDADDIDPAAMFWIDEYLPRTLSRVHVARDMVKVSPNTRFFGNPGWLLWPDLGAHHGGEITDPRMLAGVYRESALSVHVTHWPFHFRTIDCMASGGVILVNRVEHPALAASFGAAFDEGTHYVGYDEDDFTETAARLLRDDDARRRIAAAAAARVAEHHTWRHRALQVLRDLEMIAGG